MLLLTETPNPDKMPRFLAIFFVTALIGVVLISLAVYSASKELEVIHEVDNTSRVFHSLLGTNGVDRLVRGEQPSARGKAGIMADSDYQFFVTSDNGLRPLQSGSANVMPILQSVDLESTRVNEHGGYFKANGATYTWAKFQNGNDPKGLLVVHKFRSAGTGALARVYQYRMIIPIAFFLWLTVGVALMFRHLVRDLHWQRDQLKQMALYDALTGLPNRKLMHDRLSKMIRASRRDIGRFAFCVIDLNGFKAVNDQYGHFYGDELLRQAATRIERALRASDTAARLVGDEFALLLNPTNVSAWRTVCERVQAALNAPYVLSSKQVTVSASIGAAIFPEHGEDADTLLFNADLAMYVAKVKGGGISVFEPTAASEDKDAGPIGEPAGSGAGI